MFLFYRVLTTILFPVFILIIYFRKYLNKEDKIRFKEKISITNNGLPENKEVFWIHAASIGEVNSIFPIIKEIKRKNKNIFILLTSTTLSSSKLIKNEIADTDNFKHLFLPLDVLFLVKKFLSYWSPKLVIFVESEVWPNYMLEISKRNIPVMLLNGRITNKTFYRWNKFPKISKKIFSLYDLCLAASKESEINLKKLGAKNVKYLGNIKFCSTVLETIQDSRIKLILNNRNVWCAASIHPGEEKVILNTHLNLKNKGKNILTILIPRHISKSKDILPICQSLNLKAQVINSDKDILKESEILIVNTIGEMSKYFSLCKNIFMGKSLLKKLIKDGGQNPIEPAKFGCKIFHGPYVSNFLEIYDYLKNKGIAYEINNENDLTERLLKNFDQNSTINTKDITELSRYGEKILSSSINEIMEL